MKILKQTPTELSLLRINWEVAGLLIAIPPVALIGTLLFAGMNARGTATTITCQRDVATVHCESRLDLMGDLPKYRRSVSEVQSVIYKTTDAGIPGLVNSQLVLVGVQGKEKILYSSTLIPTGQDAHLIEMSRQIDEFLHSQSPELVIQHSFSDQFRLNLFVSSLWMGCFFGVIWLYYACLPLRETLTFSKQQNSFTRQRTTLFGIPIYQTYPLHGIQSIHDQKAQNDVLPHLVVILRSQPACHLFAGFPVDIDTTSTCIRQFLNLN